MTKKLLNAQEAAEYLGVSLNTFRSYRRDGVIHALPVGKGKFTVESINSDIEKLIERVESHGRY